MKWKWKQIERERMKESWRKKVSLWQENNLNLGFLINNRMRFYKPQRSQCTRFLKLSTIFGICCTLNWNMFTSSDRNSNKKRALVKVDWNKRIKKKKIKQTKNEKHIIQEKKWRQAYKMVNVIKWVIIFNSQSIRLDSMKANK